MTEQFDLYEKLFRAVYPPDLMPMFWKENGKLSSAVFKDKKGLSVERAGGRTDKRIIDEMRIIFYGTIISVLVKDCIDCNSVVKYMPSKRSKYHSEIHGSEERILLTQSQCKYLADRAIVCK